MYSKCDNRDFCSGYGDTVCRAHLITETSIKARETLYVKQL